MQVTKLTPNVGAEIEGVDLSKSVDAETKAALNKAFVDNVVIVFRDQDLTPQQFRDAAMLFGEVKYQLLKQYLLPDCPEVGIVSNRDKDAKGDGKPLIRGTSWHTDHSNEARPAKATGLYSVAIPDSGGDTEFANMQAAYDALPEAMKARIQGLKGIHTYNSRFAPRKLPKRTVDEEAVSPDMTHPVVRTHPETGRKAIYLNPVRIEQFEGMEIEESLKLLNELIEFGTQPQFVYRHKWRKGDMILWDNRSALHQASTDYDMSQLRLLHRIMLEGDEPY